MMARLMFAVTALAACDAGSTGNAAPEPVTLARVATLEGEWRVAGIDGQPVEGPVGLALRANREEIWWEPRCALLVKGYKIDGSRFSALPPPSYRPSRGGPPPIMCLIAPPEQMTAVFRALESGTTIVRTPNNGIEISGGGHSLLLFSQ